MALGAIFFIDPSHPGELAVSLSIVLPIIITLGLLLLCVIYLLFKAQRYKKTTGEEGLLGAEGEVVEDIKLNQKGRVFVQGEYWTARSHQILKRGDCIIIEKMDSLSCIWVKKREE